MLGKTIAVVSGVSALVLVLILNNSNPANVGPVGLLAVFFLLYLVLLGVFTIVSVGINRGMVRVSRLVTVRRPLARIGLRRIYYISSVLALGPVMMIAMKSIGSLGLYEVILVVLFLAIALLYVSKRET
ncbi:hypothetical protein KBD87_04120 [Candidatus Saccharibacteria bacterium]|nr:hypothetical protein [Candidatus Saccharibacteria bacterium]